MNNLAARVDPWRLVVGAHALALTVHASPGGYGGGLIALGSLGLIAALTLSMAWSRKSVPRWLALWIIAAVAFCAFAALSSLWSVSPRVSLEDAVTTTIMLTFLALTVATRWQESRTLRGDMTWTFGIVLVLMVSALVAGMMGVDTIYDPDYGRFRGWFSNANYAGMMSVFGLAVALPALLISRGEGKTSEEAWLEGAGLTRHQRWVAGLGCALLVATLVLAQSRGAMLSLGLAVLILLLPRVGWRRAVATLVLAGAIGGATVVLNGLTNLPPGVSADADADGNSKGKGGGVSFDPITRDSATDVTSGRGEIYRELLSSAKDHPVGGTGYRTTELNPLLDGTAGHNIYLSTFAEVGAVGGLLFLVVLAVPLFRALSQYRVRAGAAAATGAATVALSEVFESSILGWGSPTTMIAWLVLLGGASAAAGRVVHKAPAEVT